MNIYSSTAEAGPDPLGELRGPLHAELARHTMRWAAGRDMDWDAITRTRRAAVSAVHRHLLGNVPAYRSLAAISDTRPDAPFEEIAAQMLSPDQIFKSYPQAAVDAGDFAAMNAWLRRIYHRDIEIPTDDITHVDQWLRRLAEAGVHVVFSSGTSGRLSFVPRDEANWRDFHDVPMLYAPLLMARRGVGAAWQQGLAKVAGRLLSAKAFLAMVRRLGFRDFDGIMLSFASGRQGIQLAGEQISNLTRQNTFLYDTEITATAIRALTRGPSNATESEIMDRFVAETIGGKDQNYDRVIEASHRCGSDGQKILLFGAPYLLKEYCDRIIASGRPVQAKPGSMVLYGGGWKSFEGERIPEQALIERIEAALGIPASHVIEGYSMTELHALMAKCQSGRFHVPPYLETLVLDDALEPIAGSEVRGTLAVMDPYAVSYPGLLITGDEVLRADARCPCGLDGVTLRDLGRAAGREVKGCGGIMAAANGAATSPVQAAP